MRREVLNFEVNKDGESNLYSVVEENGKYRIMSYDFNATEWNYIEAEDHYYVSMSALVSSYTFQKLFK